MTHITAEILMPGFHISNSGVLYTSVCRYTDTSESELLHEHLFTLTTVILFNWRSNNQR